MSNFIQALDSSNGATLFVILLITFIICFTMYNIIEKLVDGFICFKRYNDNHKETILKNKGKEE